MTGRGFVHIRAIKPWSVAGFVGIGTLISLIDEQHAGLPALPTLTVTEAADQSPMSDSAVASGARVPAGRLS